MRLPISPSQHSAGHDRLDVAGVDAEVERQQALGHARQALRVAGGEEQSLVVELPVTVNVLTPPATTTSPPAEPKHESSVLASPWLWTIVGVAVAGGAVGLGFALSSGGTRNASANGGTTETVLRGP